MRGEVEQGHALQVGDSDLHGQGVVVFICLAERWVDGHVGGLVVQGGWSELIHVWDMPLDSSCPGYTWSRDCCLGPRLEGEGLRPASVRCSPGLHVKFSPSPHTFVFRPWGSPRWRSRTFGSHGSAFSSFLQSGRGFLHIEIRPAIASYLQRSFAVSMRAAMSNDQHWHPTASKKANVMFQYLMRNGSTSEWPSSVGYDCQANFWPLSSV